MRRVDPTNDLLFKKSLASKGNEDVLRGLISDFFGFEPEQVILENPYSIEDFKEILNGEETTVLRETRSDIRASLITASFTAEMQVKATKFFDERALYYACYAYCEAFNKQEEPSIQKDRYVSIKPVYAMNILKYVKFSDDRAFRVYGMLDKETYSEMPGAFLNTGFLELSKAGGLTERQRYWIEFFNTGEAPEGAPEYIKKAARTVSYVNMSKEEQTMYDMAEKARFIREAEMSYAISEGRAEGRAEGRVEGEAKEAMRAATELYLKTRDAGLVRSVFPGLPRETLDKIVESQSPQTFAEKLNMKRQEAAQTPRKTAKDTNRDNR